MSEVIPAHPDDTRHILFLRHAPTALSDRRSYFGSPDLSEVPEYLDTTTISLEGRNRLVDLATAVRPRLAATAILAAYECYGSTSSRETLLTFLGVGGYSTPAQETRAFMKRRDMGVSRQLKPVDEIAASMHDWADAISPGGYVIAAAPRVAIAAFIGGSLGWDSDTISRSPKDASHWGPNPELDGYLPDSSLTRVTVTGRGPMQAIRPVWVGATAVDIDSDPTQYSLDISPAK